MMDKRLTTKARVRTRVIMVDNQARADLMRLHACSESGLYNALAFRSNSARAERIRQDALEKFGGYLDTRYTFKKI